MAVRSIASVISWAMDFQPMLHYRQGNGVVVCEEFATIRSREFGGRIRRV